MAEESTAGLLVAQRLKERLKREYERLGESYKRLEEAIHSANGKQPGLKIDRRKLSDIVLSERSVPLTLQELQALDTYLLKQGSGLATVFHQETVMTALARTRRVTFLLGSERLGDPDPAVTGFARADVLSMAPLLRGIERAGEQVRERVHFDLLEVYSPGGQALKEISSLALQTEPWCQCLASGPSAPSVISLGFTRACLATEIMLARMFGFKAFEQRPGDDPPFRFILTPDAFKNVPSALTRSSGSIEGDNYDPGGRDTVGMIIEGEEMLVRRNPDRWEEWGIVAIQRRPSGQVWLVIAGLTGPATYAAARLVEESFGAYPPDRAASTTNVDPPVLWAAVQAVIGNDRESRSEDKRKVISQTLLFEPKLWTPGRK